MSFGGSHRGERVWNVTLANSTIMLGPPIARRGFEVPLIGLTEDQPMTA